MAMPASRGFQVFCSNHPTILVRVAVRQIESALAGQPITDLRAIPLLVPSAMMRDRLRDDLAELAGVCAGVDLLLPAEFAARWLPGRLGVEVRGIDVDAGRWRVCAALDDAPQIAPARRDAWDARRLALATRLTDTLVRLSHWAGPHSTEAWSAGKSGRFDATYPYLPGLWSALAASSNPQAVQRDLLAAIATASDLPPLVLAFATPDLAPPLLEVLAALGRRTRVQVVLAQPVPGDWSDQALPWKRGDDADAPWSNRLLAQWGVEHRHALRRLDAAGAEILSDTSYFIPAERQTVLAQVQRDLLAGQVPTPGILRDDSLVFQHAYGPRAEAEALKHRLVAWMSSQGIAPHQVCIACPDPDAYAPMLAAVFASPGEGPPVAVDLRSGSASGDPATAAALQLLELLPGRWTATQVLALLASAPVADAWDLDGSWHQRVHRWCDEADLRFGADATHRLALGLPEESGATWRRGLQRLAWSRYLGADTAAVALHDGVAPVDGLDEGDVIAIERLTEILLPLLDAAAAWREPHPARWWAEQIATLTRHCRHDQRDASDAQLGQLLGRWQQDVADGGATGALLTADLVSVILQDARASAPLRAGGIAVGTPMGLRGHPWAIVCCIGMDDGAFPRQLTGSDIDPLVPDPVPGQPDPRHQDRASLLDLLIASEHHALFSWTGHDPRNGETLPPCPAIGDLLDAVRITSGAAASDQLVDVIGLGALSGVAPGPWPSRARRDQAAAIPRGVASALVPDAPLSLPDAAIISLDELRMAVADPPKAYLRRLGIRLGEVQEVPDDCERLVLDDQLENWQLRDSLVDHLRAGGDPETLLARWTATGQIPRGTWGRLAVTQLLAKTTGMFVATEDIWTASVPSTQRLRVELDDGTVITGLCARVHPELGPVSQNPGSDGAKHRQRAWLHGLLWQATGNTGGGVLLHLTGDRRMLTYATQSAARDALRDLVAWYRRCLSTPCPLLPDVVDAIAKQLGADSEQDLRTARQAWTRSSWGSPAPPPGEFPSARWLWPAGTDAWRSSAATIAGDAVALGAKHWTATALDAAAQPQGD